MSYVPLLILAGLAITGAVIYDIRQVMRRKGSGTTIVQNGPSSYSNYWHEIGHCDPSRSRRG